MFFLNGTLHLLAWINTWIFGIGVIFLALAFGQAGSELCKKPMAKRAGMIRNKMAEEM